MKKKILTLAAMVICLAAMASGTHAYFTSKDQAHNVITSGSVDIELIETTNKLDANNKPILFEDVTGVMPGTAVSKIVQVKNTGSGDAYVRVKVDTGVDMASGSNAVPGYEPISIEYATGTNATSWTEDGGYFYYNSPLKAGELTKPLFAEVFFKPSMGNEYQNSKVSVNVIAHGTQVANNGESALEADGWPED